MILVDDVVVGGGSAVYRVGAGAANYIVVAGAAVEVVVAALTVDCVVAVTADYAVSAAAAVYGDGVIWCDYQVSTGRSVDLGDGAVRGTAVHVVVGTAF